MPTTWAAMRMAWALASRNAMRLSRSSRGLPITSSHAESAALRRKASTDRQVASAWPKTRRIRRKSRLPTGKTWETFEHDRVPLALRQQLDHLAQGSFVERGVNVLAFGLPGTGKTHALCALGHRLVEAGQSVLFAPAYRLVQELLAAKRDLDLPRRLRKLDNFDFLLLDDLGYLPQGAEESEVLFTLIAERYERRSLGITSNLVFSQWEHIFANPMATAAAIDRVVHHSVILEFDVPSYRTDAAQQRGQAEQVNRQE